MLVSAQSILTFLLKIYAALSNDNRYIAVDVALAFVVDQTNRNVGVSNTLP